MWPLADDLAEAFDGYAKTDTATIIDGYEKLVANATERSTENLFVLGRLLVLTGQFSKGRTFLNEITSGERATTNGYRYLTATYYKGIAEENLGNREAAKQLYSEVLQYWDSPQIELKQIADTRKRLARLTS